MLPAGFWSHLLFKTSLYHWPAPSTAVTNNQESSTPSPATKFWQVKAKNRLHTSVFQKKSIQMQTHQWERYEMWSSVVCLSHDWLTYDFIYLTLTFFRLSSLKPVFIVYWFVALVDGWMGVTRIGWILTTRQWRICWRAAFAFYTKIVPPPW